MALPLENPDFLHQAVFVERPAPVIVDDFREHVKASGSPETFRGISTTPVDEGALHDAIILCDFEVDPKKREGERLVPCPVCCPSSPKYLNGVLVYFPSEMVIRAIGQECGARFDADWHRKKANYRIEQRRKVTEEYLFNRMHEVPALRRSLLGVVGRCTAQRKTWSDFRRKAPEIVKCLRSSMKSGRLTIAEKTSTSNGMRTSTGRTSFAEQTIGFVTGQSAVASSFRHHTEGREQERHLQSVDFGDDPEVTGLKICEMDPIEMQAVERIIMRGQKQLEKSNDKANDFASFFSDQNIERINTWAAHPSSPMNFELRLVRNVSQLRISCSAFSLETITVLGL